MCTSFVLCADKTYIGMNFDIFDRPILLSLKGSDQLIVLQYDGAGFQHAFGINQSGTFMNMLMVEPNEAGKYRRGKDCIHVSRLFDEILGGKFDPASVDRLLIEKAIVNGPAMVSVYNMLAMVGRQVWVVEPGRGVIPFGVTGNDFMALTNFPLSDFIGRDYSQVTGGGADRYKTYCLAA